MTENEKAKKTPALRFKGFTDDWEQRKLRKLLRTLSYKPYLKTPEQDGKYEIIQQGNDPIIGFANGEPCEDFRNTVIFGDHTLSLYKPSRPFFVATDGVRILQGVDEMDGNYLLSLLEINRPKSEGYKRYYSILADRDVFFTNNREEQIHIGAYFRNLDNLITLHQKEVSSLQIVKKSMLEKMFPKEGAKVPEIRFSGFTDDWEQRKLGNCFTSLQNNTLSRAELSDENGVAMNVHYGDVLIKFGECLDVSKETLPFIEKQSAVNKFKTSYLQNGDVIVADTAEDETVGKCTEIMGITNQKVISGLHTIPLRPNRKFAAGYLGFYLNSAAYHDQLNPLMQGIKVTSISKSAMQDTVIRYPSDGKEQELIGRYFINLDNLITLHQKEADKFTMFKKSLLTGMFPK